ncbi:hypothetical protein RSAG8_07876, partial [Rhizoctonia solani AG-8 WAC10335]
MVELGPRSPISFIRQPANRVVLNSNRNIAGPGRFSAANRSKNVASAYGIKKTTDRLNVQHQHPPTTQSSTTQRSSCLPSLLTLNAKASRPPLLLALTPPVTARRSK